MGQVVLFYSGVEYVGIEGVNGKQMEKKTYYTFSKNWIRMSV